MKVITPYIRKAFIDRLYGHLTYLGQIIPVDDGQLNGPPALIYPAGGAVPVEAYCILQNQTVQDDSAFCNINQNTQLQLDVVTVFKANSGNRSHADFITNNIFALLFTTDPKRLELTLDDPDLKVWRGWLDNYRGLPPQDSKDWRIFRNMLFFELSVAQ